MKVEPCHLETLVRVLNEIEATVIANALGSEGIESSLAGVHTASFRAEAPGLVSLLVRQEDLNRARQILDELKSDVAAIDWENIDVGQPE